MSQSIIGIIGIFISGLTLVLLLVPALNRYRNTDKVIHGEKIASWNYTQQVWDEHLLEEKIKQKNSSMGFVLAFLIIVCLGLVLTLNNLIHEAGKSQAFLLVAGFLICPYIAGIILDSYAERTYSKRRKSPREALIAKEGVYINGQGYVFDFDIFGIVFDLLNTACSTQLFKIRINEQKNRMTFFLFYDLTFSRGPNFTRSKIVNLPIPEGEMESAKKIKEKLDSQINIDPDRIESFIHPLGSKEDYKKDEINTSPTPSIILKILPKYYPVILVILLPIFTVWILSSH